jgi:hypothetical protein
MKNHLGAEEIRWQVVKSIIDEFPSLRVKVKEYIRKQSD